MSSLPLSLTIISGFSRLAIIASSSRATRRAGDRGVDNQRQALAGEVVDNDEHPKASTIGQHVGDKVEAPALIRPLRQCHRRACAEGSLAAAAAAHRQSFLSVEPEQLLVVQLDPFAPQ